MTPQTESQPYIQVSWTLLWFVEGRSGDCAVNAQGNSAAPKLMEGRGKLVEERLMAGIATLDIIL